MPFHRCDTVRLTLVILCMGALSLMALPANARDGERDKLDWWSAPSASKQLAQIRCNNIYKPVCGTWRGRRRTFRNLCRAVRARATGMRGGACTVSACSNRLRPVCGFAQGRRRTFRNICWARRARATAVRAGKCATLIRTCHQRATSRRYRHIAGRSWNPACRVAPIRTCHQRATSRRYRHIRGRSWNPACRAGVAPPAPPAPRAKRAGDACVGRDGQGIPFNGRLVVDQRGGLNCIAGGAAP